MDPIAAAFWGAFFGTAILLLGVAVLAFYRSMPKVAAVVALPPGVLVLFVAAHLDGLGLPAAALARLQAHVAVAASATLSLMMLALLGVTRRRGARRRAQALVLGAVAAVLAAGWLLPPAAAQRLGLVGAFGIGLAMLPIAVDRMLRRQPLAWVAVAGLVLTLTTLAALGWTVLHPPGHWGWHALAATFAMAYLVLMASALWTRFAYLLEMSWVRPQGSAYDPVTRLRSHSETGQMVADVLAGSRAPRGAVGVLAISIGNLYALEKLHGRQASNHALFVCAGRLRRCVPIDVEMGRLGEDGFLLLVRQADQADRMAALARLLRERLARPIVLGTGVDAGRTEWQAEIGIGLLPAGPLSRTSEAVARARALSRTAWGYPSRLASYDPVTRRMVEFTPGPS